MTSEAHVQDHGIRGNRTGRSNGTADKEIGIEINDHPSVQHRSQDHLAQVFDDQHQVQIQIGQHMLQRSQYFILQIVDKTDHESRG